MSDRRTELFGRRASCTIAQPLLESSFVEGSIGGASVDISYFDEYVELARQLNFTEAAKALNITQSALSKHVASLEKELGATLLVRSRKKVELTEAGKVFFDKAMSIAKLYQEAKEEVSLAEDRPPIRVAGLLQNYEIINLLSRTFQLLEGSDDGCIRIVFSPISMNDFLPRLRAGDVDACICIRPEESQLEPDIAFELLWPDRFIAVVDQCHPFSARASLKLEDLHDEDFLQLVSEQSMPAWQCIERVCNEAGFSPKRRSHLIQNAVEYAATDIDDTVYIVPTTSYYIGPLRHASNLAGIPIEDEFAFFPIGVAYSSKCEGRLEVFLDALKEAADLMNKSVARMQGRPRPFRNRCRDLCARHKLNADEETAVLLYAKGNSVERIALNLGTDQADASACLEAALEKLGVSSRQELIDHIDAKG